MATTPFMNLSLPVPTVTLGPAWAQSINDAITLIDSHDHSTGKGVKVTPLGMNINSALALNENNLDNANSYRMKNNSAALTGPSDLRSLYTVTGELFYNDGSGNNVQITSSGGINAASIGAIGGDYASSTALLSYNNISKTFLFEQNTGIQALIDCADITIREAILSANGIKLKSPTSLSTGYDLTLPTGLPASQKFLTVDAAGAMGLTTDVDNSTIEISSDLIQVKDGGITGIKFNANAVDDATIELFSNALQLKDGGVTLAKLAFDADLTIETFAVDGTFNVPAKTNNVMVIATGGGGGGGGGGGSATTSSAGGGAGGTGSNPMVASATVTPSGTVSVTLGVGGTGGAGGISSSVGGTGSAGGNTTFGSLLTFNGATGGVGGVNPGAGGAGGTGNSNTWAPRGQISGSGSGGSNSPASGTPGAGSIYASGGAAGTPSTGGGAGGGGAAFDAGGVGGNGGSNTSPGDPGIVGTSGSGGGGGGGNGTNNAGGAGGAGAGGGDGKLIVLYAKLI